MSGARPGGSARAFTSPGNSRAAPSVGQFQADAARAGTTAAGLWPVRYGACGSWNRKWVVSGWLSIARFFFADGINDLKKRRHDDDEALFAVCTTAWSRFDCADTAYWSGLVD